LIRWQWAVRLSKISSALLCQTKDFRLVGTCITAQQAFDVLRRASEHLNVKLCELASYVVETGEVPADWNR
jgi:hypothetical protein